jgi:hypothetical protein
MKRYGYNKLEELKTIEEEIKKLKSYKTTLDKNNIKSTKVNFFNNSSNINLNKRLSYISKNNLNSSVEENKLDNLRKNNRAVSTAVRFIRLNSIVKKNESLASIRSVSKHSVLTNNKSTKKN